MNAKRLPSGNYRCQVYDYTDQNGRRHYKSFTAATKKRSELLAAKYALNKKAVSGSARDITLREAMDEYIAMKRNILSPATIRGYLALQKYSYGNLLDLQLVKITSLDVQRWANVYAADHSPKTVKNAHGFLSAVMYAYLPNMVLRTTLPGKIRCDPHTPNDQEVQALISYYMKSDKDMLIASNLAAFGTMRRSEICGLSASDVDGNTLHIRSACVLNADNKFMIKPFPKNYSSARDVVMPKFVIDMLPREGPLVRINPNQVTDRHRRAVLKLGLPGFRFHDLRHYAASIMHALGIPDQYIMERGGWKTDVTLKEIYRGTIDDYSLKFQQIAIAHFEDMQHEIQHGEAKIP